MSESARKLPHLFETFNGQIRRIPAVARYAAWYGAMTMMQRRLLVTILAVAAFGLLELMVWLATGSRILVIGLLASMLAGLATGAGALPILFFRDVPDRVLNVLLGAAAGVMLSATAFSLIVPGIQYGNQIATGYGAYIVVAGMLIGASFLDWADRRLPHGQFVHGRFHGPAASLRRIWLFVLAITIHNFPEGLAVGVSFGAGDQANGIILAIAIALQNMPEGLAVALPLLTVGATRRYALWVALLTGLVEPVGGFLGVAMVAVFYPVLPAAMGFAAGAMLFVIVDEIIPETHSKGKSRATTFGLMVGFVLMTILDNVLGGGASVPVYNR